MALLLSELTRIKIELGYNALGLSALPYAIDGITQLFEQIVQPYLQAGALTYSSTVVAAASAPTPVPLTVTSAMGINVGDRVVVDQDGAQEFAHVAVVTGSAVTVALLNAHIGTYPVSVEGGESTARYYLGQCIAIADRIARSGSRAGVKSIDKGDLEFYASTPSQKGPFDQLVEQQRYWRSELATALGVENLREARHDSGQLLESY